MLHIAIRENVNVYQMTLDNAILPSVEPSGQIVYQNAGAVNQQGLEGKVVYTPIQDETKAISLVRVWSTVTFQDFQFGDWLVNGESLVRNLVIGHRSASYYGKVSKIGYTPFSYGIGNANTFSFSYIF